jgi:anti-sigma factor RsiW
MTCASVHSRLSEWLDGDLEPAAARAVGAHVAACPACSRHAGELRAVSTLLSELPRLEAAEPIAPRVADRLELVGGARRPALAFLFRGVAAARPLILPSLVPAALLLTVILAGVLALDSGPLPRYGWRPGGGGSSRRRAPKATRSSRRQRSISRASARRSPSRPRSWRAGAKARSSSKRSSLATARSPASPCSREMLRAKRRSSRPSDSSASSRFAIADAGSR